MARQNRVVPGARPDEVDLGDLIGWTWDKPPGGVSQNLPYLVVTNSDTVAHVITAQLRNGGGSIPHPVSAGSIISIPTNAFKQASIDSGGTASSVGGYYSDIPVQGGPSSGGGAPSVANHGSINITPNANATFQMCGLGALGTNPFVMTPLKSGRVFVFASVAMNGKATGDYVYLKWAYGTPSSSAPALNAAATGTVPNAADGVAEGAATGLSDATVGATVSCLVTGLTIGMSYWFDLQAEVTLSGTDVVSYYGGGLIEVG